jgi:hypothetical protein
MDIYDEMMELSRAIAATFPQPRFYGSCAAELAESRRLYAHADLVACCRAAVASDLARNPSHGLDHAEKVAVEAGALVLAEGAKAGIDGRAALDCAGLAQAAGLLHDMRRTEKNHAQSGSVAAGALLRGLGVPDEARQCVTRAIANHEAFIEPPFAVSGMGRLVSDALYDADKFRWGPDNFTVTLWEMLRFARMPVAAVVPRFPQGMEGVARIEATFRSRTGALFGPEFIDLGLSIGNRIYEVLRERFGGR